MEDRLLVWRCKRGGAEAMTQIYQKYRKDLLILAVTLLNDKTAAEDVVQDVFVNFAAGLPHFRLTGSLRAYLMTCVANRARNHNKTRRPVEASRTDTAASHQSEPEPSERLVCSERLTRLAEALDRLSYEQRETVMLHLHSGLSLRRIAKERGLSPNTVMSRYRYAIEKLRSLLNGECDHEI